MNRNNTQNLNVLPKQLKFLRSNAREVLYSGAFGSGKTRAICLKVVMRACLKGAREGLCRKTYVSLKKSTLKTLLEPDGLLAPVLPHGTYEFKKSDGEINIIGGGTIMLFGLEDAGRVASMNLSGVAVDEAVELTEQDWTMLRGRIRLSLPYLSNQIYGACNPSTPQHFLAKRFGLVGGYSCKDNCEAITTTSRDNWYLPKGYIEDLETMTGVARKRFVEGIWCGSEGLVYDQWSEEKYVVDEFPDSFDRLFVGMDEGWNNPAVALLIGIKDEVTYVIKEWYESKKLEQEVVHLCKTWKEEYPEIECFILDPSAVKLREAMRHIGLDAVPADNTVFNGIQTVAGKLRKDERGVPLLQVGRECSNLIREFGSYEWLVSRDGTLKEQPAKQHDHALDALRYTLVYAFGLRTQPSIRVVDSESGNENIIDPLSDERYWTEI